MKVNIDSLRWNYREAQNVGEDIEPVCVGTQIEVTVDYPATENTHRASFHGYVYSKDRVCDMKEAKKIVENIVKK